MERLNGIVIFLTYIQDSAWNHRHPVWLYVGLSTQVHVIMDFITACARGFGVTRVGCRVFPRITKSNPADVHVVVQHLTNSWYIRVCTHVLLAHVWSHTGMAINMKSLAHFEHSPTRFITLKPRRSWKYITDAQCHMSQATRSSGSF